MIKSIPAAAAAAATVLIMACNPSGARAPAPAASPDPLSDTGHVLRLAPMDSATIERLCAKPDSVRAGKAECVLKDQSPPARPLPPRTPPPG